VKRRGRKLGQFHANAVGVDDVGEGGLGAAEVRLADGGSPRLDRPTTTWTVLLTGSDLALALVLPPPHGWIGTVDDWSRGLGIAFVLLALAVLAVSWGRLRRAGLTPGLKELLVLPLVVLPPAIVFFGYAYGIESVNSTTHRSCAGEFRGRQPRTPKEQYLSVNLSGTRTAPDPDASGKR